MESPHVPDAVAQELLQGQPDILNRRQLLWSLGRAARISPVPTAASLLIEAEPVRAASSPSASNACVEDYTAKGGDTEYGVWQEYYQANETFPEFQSDNAVNVPDPKLMQPGDHLRGRCASSPNNTVSWAATIGIGTVVAGGLAWLLNRRKTVGGK